jgi:glycosyltransferase involved in cell wall biosynthesis
MNSARKILQITAYPPPRCGWGVRVQFLKRRLENLGHTCVVLNTGPRRTIPGDEYVTVLSGWDYLLKVWRYSRKGFVAHAHVNGKSTKGIALTLVAEIVNLLWGKRCFLTFHAGEEQDFFPRSRSRVMRPFFWLMFSVPRHIICNSKGVKAKIAEYGISPLKITPIPAFSCQYLQFERVSLGPELEQFYGQFTWVIFCYLHLQAGHHPDVLIEAFARVAQARADLGLVLCGTMGHREDRPWQELQQRIRHHKLGNRIALVEDLDHDQFLTALTRSSVYVRTPPADGVSSSVLEALALRVPVIAAANGSRPEGVLTYAATDVQSLEAQLRHVLANSAEIVAAIPPPTITDTLDDEARLLIA